MKVHTTKLKHQKKTFFAQNMKPESITNKLIIRKYQIMTVFKM